MNSLFEKQANQSLQEAELRKKLEETKQPTKQKKEIGGPKGLEPIRYGDWEKKGIVYDF